MIMIIIFIHKYGCFTFAFAIAVVMCEQLLGTGDVWVFIFNGCLKAAQPSKDDIN